MQRVFFSKKRICKHKRYYCNHGSNSQAESLIFSKATYPVPCTEEFHLEILSKFREDVAGNLCRKDMVILLFGQKAWAKSAKKERRTIMTDMRVLANLILQMRLVASQPTIQGEDVVDRKHFDTLTYAIQNLCKLEGFGKEKFALKLSLGYMLKKVIKIMKGYYIQKDDMEKAFEVGNFQSVLDHNWDFLFYSAQLACERRRNTLRKLTDMPLEEDVEKFRHFIVTEIQTIMQDEYTLWDYHKFVWLRNLIVSRLTLYNARRGSEPARLTLSEWKEAEEGQWVDPELAEKITDPLEEALLGGTKLAYMSGKGSRKLVPVLVPNESIEAVRKLVSERKNVGIVGDNVFLFPNSNNSRDHVSGYSCIKSVAAAMGEKLKKPNLLIADKFRHRASTLFALLDLPEEEREGWYRHMGHSAAINRDVYQSPLAIREMTRIGGFLKNLDCLGKNTIAKKKKRNTQTHTWDQTITSPSTNTSLETPKTSLPASSKSEDNILLNLSNESEMLEVSSNESQISGVTLQAESAIDISARHQEKRQYTHCNDKDASNVSSHFDKYIKLKGTGSKGSLPGAKEVEEFLYKFDIFQRQNITKKRKITLIKSKVFNERKKYRSLTEEYFESI